MQFVFEEKKRPGIIKNSKMAAHKELARLEITTIATSNERHEEGFASPTSRLDYKCAEMYLLLKPEYNFTSTSRGIGPRLVILVRTYVSCKWNVPVVRPALVRNVALMRITH